MGNRLLIAVAVLCVGFALTRTVDQGSRPYEKQPEDSFQYAEGAWSLAHGDGYVTFDGERPRYPMGMSVLLAPVTRVGVFPVNVQDAAVLVACGLIGLVFALAWRLGGPAAAAVAALVCGWSPAFTGIGRVILSDPAAAGMVVGSVLAVLAGRRWLAALLVGLSAWVRLTNLALAPLVRWRVVVPIVVALVVAQVVLFGSLSSYAGDEASWSLHWLWHRPSTGRNVGLADHPNWLAYPLFLMGVGGWLVPGVPVLAGWELWRRRGEEATRLVVGVCALTYLAYVTYFYQSARFMLPVAALLVAYAAAGIARVLTPRGRA